MFLSNILRGYRVLSQNGATVESRNVLELRGGTLTDDPANNRTIYDVSAGGLSPTGLTLGTSYTATGAASPIITTDATVTNIGAPIAVAAGKLVAIRAQVMVSLIGDGTNPASTGGWLHAKVLAKRAGASSPAIAPASGDDGSIAIYPFAVASPISTATPGALSAVVTGNNVQLQVAGGAYGVIGPPWAGTTAYTQGKLVTNGGNLYCCLTDGTSAGSGGPSGTGASIPDGTGNLTWCYVEGDGKVTISWTLALLEVLTG